MALVLAGLLLASAAGFSAGAADAMYNPYIRIGGVPLTPGSFFTFLAWGLFCFFPAVMSLAWDLHWKRLEAGLSVERCLPWYLTEERDRRKFTETGTVRNRERNYGRAAANEGGNDW